MPPHRKPMKSTGDTRPPELDAAAAPPYERYAPHLPEHRYAPVLEGIDFTLLQGSPANLVRAWPLPSMLVAAAVGYMVARAARR